MNKKYQPSSGTEGMAFMSDFCFNCKHENDCQIMGDTMLYDIADDEYPKEWTFDDNSNPVCTRFESIDDRCPKTRDMFEQ